MIKEMVKKLVRRYSTVHLTQNYVQPDNLLKNKVAVITGGASGIGFSIAEKFVSAGAKVILVGRNEEKLKTAVERMGGEARYIVCDVSVYENCLSIVSYIEEVMWPGSQIDILVNNAGIQLGPNQSADFLSMDEKSYDAVLDTNLKGTFFITQTIIKYYLEHTIRGHVLNICSIEGMRSITYPYGISKWGMIGLTKGLAKYFARDGITINGIAPGATATEMMKYHAGDSLVLDRVPSGRFSTPEEIANLSLFLCSDMGSNMIGSVVVCDSGESL